MEVLNYLKALADETRLRIVSLLSEGELNVNEIVEILAMGQSRISRHLKILLDAGIVKCRKDGLWAFYSLSSSDFANNLLDFLYGAMTDEIFESDRISLKLFKEEKYIKEREFFDNIAPGWSSIKKELLCGFDLNEYMLRELNGARVVADLGCGNGELALLLAQKGARVIGVDHSPVMLEIARDLFVKKNLVNGEFRLGELYHLPLKNKEVDMVVINMVLHYLDNPLAVLKESFRILKNKGRLVIGDFLPHNNEQLRVAFSHRWLGFSESLIYEWLNHCGFSSFTMNKFEISQSLGIFICSCTK
ncbi:MAG TPA: metalloregulator ArsR/SmtB family transcription factor [Spirochaetota bacterium]|nr:metalloregulator ArsR/SmtB family transcription factor [Spirochaetota bacterium]HPP95156.1 metalloregulator ArsR/SmtB family transcription factor [Spirochaetota bacterium]HRS62088.1 metalloregulator ArsR/SmtB family transcription factor [Spirochaetota bacterium]